MKKTPFACNTKGRIVITHCSLQEDAEEVWKMSKDDEVLINAIKKESEEQSLHGVETFERRHNIIVTDQGYYFAFYENDLRQTVRDSLTP